MPFFRIAFLILGLLPCSIWAQTTLYACTIKGHTTLESIHEKDCDTLVTYHYPTYDHFQQGQEEDTHITTAGLRPEEMRQLQVMEAPVYSQESQMRRYENIDERIGWSAVHDYYDSRVDKCAIFRGELDSALLYIAAKNSMMIDIGPFRSAELATRILQAQPEVNYYCH